MTQASPQKVMRNSLLEVGSTSTYTTRPATAASIDILNDASRKDSTNKASILSTNTNLTRSTSHLPYAANNPTASPLPQYSPLPLNATSSPRPPSEILNGAYDFEDAFDRNLLPPTPPARLIVPTVVVGGIRLIPGDFSTLIEYESQQHHLGTRKELLQDLMQWATAQHSKGYWLTGDSGYGKVSTQ
jgi:hypothetical protein